MRIGICDDSWEDAKLIENTCKKTYDEIGEEYEIVIFDRAEGVLSYEGDLQLLILDIEMPGMDGLELQEKIQKIYTETTIIFVTSHDELVWDAFGLNVFGFVVKHNVKDSLPDYLRRYLEFVSPSIVLDEGIRSSDVIYIQAAGEYQDFYLKSGEIVGIRRTMYECEELLKDYDFIRIHKSYIVNFAYVDKIHNSKVYIKGHRLGIADRMKKEIKDKFREYCKRKSRFC